LEVSDFSVVSDVIIGVGLGFFAYVTCPWAQGCILGSVQLS